MMNVRSDVCLCFGWAGLLLASSGGTDVEHRSDDCVRASACMEGDG